MKKLQEEDHLAIFKPGLWQTGCGKEWYHFQQELMVSKRLLNFLASLITLSRVLLALGKFGDFSFRVFSVFLFWRFYIGIL